MISKVLVLLFATHFSIATSTTPVRLVGGQNKYEGRVEIYHNGWGTICDDSFGKEEATVICRMLGYFGNATAFSRAHFGQGSGIILLDDTVCIGNETDISACGNRGWGTNNCQHSEDSGVRCQDLTLIGGRGNYEGRIVLQDSGQLMSVCGMHFGDSDASVLCRSLGFTSGKSMPGGYYGKGTGRMVSWGLHCVGTEENLNLCPGNLTKYANNSQTCNHTTEAGVRCSHTPVRLVGGSLPSEGRVEIQHNGVWGTVCGQGFIKTDADVLCNMLGFNHSAVAVVTDGRFGQGKDPVWLSNPACFGNESDIYQCSLTDGWDNNTCTHASDVGIQCEATDIRLVDGPGPWEGRLEVNLDGRWGAVCDTGFGDPEANVVCRMLGYTGRDSSHRVYKSSFFGTSTRTHFDRLRCNGDEIDISQCAADFYSTCSRGATVGLSCAGVQVRLVDGPNSGAGRVEVFHNKAWGSICDSKWDDRDATVVCRMLVSYPLDRRVTGKALSGSHFGDGKGRVWMADVHCNGTEHDIMQCNFDATGGINCGHRRDAVGLPVRLINGMNDTDHPNGRVEVFDNSQWRGVCGRDWTTTDAKVVCDSLGYWTANATLAPSRTNNRNSSSGYDLSLKCKGNESSIALCPLEHEWGSQFCGDDLEIGCTPTPIGSTNIRLVDGPGPWKGRLEVKRNGRWGSFCSSNWDTTNSDLVCKTLGYKDVNATFYTAQTGFGMYRSFVETASIMFESMNCHGNETDIGYCTVSYNTTSCLPVGIDCSDGISGSLSDGGTLSGQVYMYPGNGTVMRVCKTGVNTSAARVICSMAGYRDTSPVIIPSIYSASPLPVMYTDFECDGSETHVTQCFTQSTNGTCSESAFVRCFNCTKTFNSASGWLTSPHYPNYYDDDTDCLYHIETDNFSTHKILKMKIHDLQLTGDGDYIQVLQYARNRELGMFASSVSNKPYLVSSNGLFHIRFKTNGFGNSARGFNISWSPLEIQDAMTIKCNPDGWNINVNTTILRQLYPDTGVSQIKLSDSSCTGYVNGDLVVFTQSYTKCSTQTKVTTDSIIYSNQLVYPDSKDPFPLIIHGYRWKVDVKCELPRRDITDTNFHPNHTTGNQRPQIGSTTHYSSSIKFYTDGTFYKEITGNPVSLKTGQDVYVAVSLNSADGHVKMRLHTCTAKPNINSDAKLTYTLIKDGCVVDPDTTILSQGTHVTRFVFNAFEFPVDHSNVYVSCNATFCQSSDVSAACSQTCSPNVAIIGR